MLPDDTASMLTSEKYGLTMKDAKTLAILDDGDRLDYYFDVVELLKQELSADELVSNNVGKVAANWYVGDFHSKPLSQHNVSLPHALPERTQCFHSSILPIAPDQVSSPSSRPPSHPIHPPHTYTSVPTTNILTPPRILHELGGLSTETPWSPTRVPSAQLASVIAHLLRRQITGRTAKQLLSSLFNSTDTRSVAHIVRDENLLLRPMVRDEYVALARELLDANPDMVRAVKEKGQRGKIGWFVGQMVRRGEEGRVEAGRAEEVVRELLGV